MLRSAENDGAPIPKDAIDPDLIKLTRPRPKIGVITAAGLVFLSVLFLWRLSPDRRFSGRDAAPARVTAADIANGKVGADSYISVEAEPLSRTRSARRPRRARSACASCRHAGPARSCGSCCRATAGTRRQSGRTSAGCASSPICRSPMRSATTRRSIRARCSRRRRPCVPAFATGKVPASTARPSMSKDGDRVAFELVEPNRCRSSRAQGELPNAAAWTTALAGAGITPIGAPTATTEQARFEVAGTLARSRRS